MTTSCSKRSGSCGDLRQLDHEPTRQQNRLATFWETAVIRLLDLPGASELEARMELLPQASPSSDDKMRSRLDRIARFLGYGVTDWGTLELPKIEDDRALRVDTDDLVLWWQRRDWDITRSDGKPCLIYSLIWEAMAYVELGVSGASRVKLEADLWRLKRDEKQAVNPAQRRREMTWLEFGERRRRRA